MRFKDKKKQKYLLLKKEKEELEAKIESIKAQIITNEEHQIKLEAIYNKKINV